MFIDYYAILGIDVNATQEEIKKAFKKQSLKYHPDKNPNKDATRRMQEINNAYKILSIPKNKVKYDAKYESYRYENYWQNMGQRKYQDSEQSESEQSTDLKKQSYDDFIRLIENVYINGNCKFYKVPKNDFSYGTEVPYDSDGHQKYFQYVVNSNNEITHLRLWLFRENMYQILKYFPRLSVLVVTPWYKKDLRLDMNTSFSNLYYLEELYFHDIYFTKIDGLKNLIGLRKLSFNSSWFIKEIEGLQNLIHLEELNLHHNEICRIKNLDSLVNLKKLDLSDNHILEITGLDSLTNLEELNLSHNCIGKMKNLNKLLCLRKLDLSRNSEDRLTLCLQTLKGGNLTQIEGINNLKQLEELNLSCNNIKKITGLDKLINLRKLDLSNNQISKIEGLENLKQLEELDLSFNNIEKIPDLNALINLHTLVLIYNPIAK